MKDLIIQAHPNNPKRFAIGYPAKRIKMLAVSVELEPDLVPPTGKNFFAATFEREGQPRKFYFCVMHLLKDEVVFWEDETILTMINAFAEEFGIGKLQLLTELRNDLVLFEVSNEEKSAA